MQLDRLSSHTAQVGILSIPIDGAPLIALPSINEKWRYAATYWSSTLRNLATTHRLQTASVRTYAARCRITPALRHKWHALFSGSAQDAEHDVAVPYLYNQSVGTLLYTRILSDLGVNFRHLLHVQHETMHYAKVIDWVAAERLELHASMQGAWRLGDGKALVAVRTAVHRAREEGGTLLGTVNDRFMIRNVPAADLEALRSGRALLRNLAGLRAKEPQLDPDTPGSVVSQLELPHNMGRRFGEVSGDFNPVHTTRLAARAFGMKRAFLQGLGLRNAVIRQMVLQGRPFSRFAMSFASPAYLGQTLRVVIQGDDFELTDKDRHVVAFGTSAAAPA